jgi:hypothetical protein
VIRTAALINGPRALRLLTGFAGDARAEVQRELIAVWHYFDPEEYAQRVLQEAPLDRGRIWITELALLPYARGLRHLTAMRLGCESTVDLASLRPSPKLSRLDLMRGWRGSTQALVMFSDLRALMLATDRPITAADVLPLTKLPELSRLWLYGDGIEQDAADALTLAKELTEVHVASVDTADLSGVARMSGLRMLGIAGSGSGSLRGLPATGLSGLSLGRLGSAPDDDPEALARTLPMLTELQLYGSDWPEDLGFVSDFPRLERLSLDHAMTGRVGSLRAPAALRHVDLGFTTEVDMTALARLPQLRRIGLRWIDRPVDLTPFRGWNGDALTIETTPAQRLTQQNGLPPTVRIRRLNTDDVRYE